MLPGTLVDTLDFEDTNELLEKEGKEFAEGKQVLYGITKVSLATNLPVSSILPGDHKGSDGSCHQG